MSVSFKTGHQAHLWPQMTSDENPQASQCNASSETLSDPRSPCRCVGRRWPRLSRAAAPVSGGGGGGGVWAGAGAAGP